MLAIFLQAPALGALSLTCTNRNRSSVSEFSTRRCSSRLRLPLVFSAIIASISMVWRAAGKFSSSFHSLAELQQAQSHFGLHLEGKHEKFKSGGR